jgi:hypothetical protein
MSLRLPPCTCGALILTNDTKDSVVTDTVFLQELIMPDRLSLYDLNNDKYHFYIKCKSGDYEELYETRRIIRLIVTVSIKYQTKHYCEICTYGWQTGASISSIWRWFNQHT